MNKRFLYIFSLTLILIFLNVFLVQAGNAELIYRIPVEGEIDPGLVSLVARGIEEAEGAGADLLVFEIDTYGGLVDSAIKIRDQIFSTSISTVSFIKGRAWSAGALISLAAEKVVMKPGTSIGAAETRPEEEKYISALRKEFKATAERRGKNSEIAASMVDKDIEIEGITASGKLLTLTTEEAVINNIADLKANNFQELWDNLQITPDRIVDINPTTPERVSRIITRPAISAIFLSVGFIGLIFEALTPGWGVGGTIGLLAFGSFFSAYIINGAASWGLVVLFLVGLVLITLEIFVVPGFGVTGIGGIAAIFASLFFLFPTTDIALAILATVLLVSIAASIIIIKYFGGSSFWKHISLGESQTKESGYVANYDKKELMGKTGKTISQLRPAGIIQIKGKRLDVVTEGDFIDKGELVEVIETSGNRIVVRKLMKEDD